MNASRINTGKYDRLVEVGFAAQRGAGDLWKRRFAIVRELRAACKARGLEFHAAFVGGFDAYVTFGTNAALGTRLPHRIDGLKRRGVLFQA